MLRQIVVPLDGSAFSATALPLAQRLAERAGATLTLITAHEPALARVPAAEPMPAGPDDVALRSAEGEYLNDTARKLGPMAGGAVDVELIDGPSGPALVEWLSRRVPDLVVMATHGRGSISRFWLGSVADHMIRHAAVPILLVRPTPGDEIDPPAPALGHGLVALDRSTEALAVLDPVGSVALAAGARLTLLSVVEPILDAEAMASYPVAIGPDVLDSIRREAEIDLERAAAQVRARGIEVDTRIVVKGGVAGAILDELNEGGADFVAMTTHGAGGLKRMVLGSVADKVIRGATKPVLVVRREA